MISISTLIIIAMIIWLLVSLIRGLAFDLYGIGSEPKMRWGGRPASGNSDKVRQGRLYLTYPVTVICIGSFVYLLLRP